MMPDDLLDQLNKIKYLERTTNQVKDVCDQVIMSSLNKINLTTKPSHANSEKTNSSSLKRHWASDLPITSMYPLSLSYLVEAQAINLKFTISLSSFITTHFSMCYVLETLDIPDYKSKELPVTLLLKDSMDCNAALWIRWNVSMIVLNCGKSPVVSF